MLLLDAGNLLFKRPSVAAGPSQEHLTAEAIMRVYQNIAYDAVGIGPLDMAGGFELLQRSAADNFPWISANIIDADGNPLFRQWISKEVQGVEVVITALTAPPKNLDQAVTIGHWESLLPDLLQQMSKEKNSPFIILLSSLTGEENRLIAEQYPAINLLLGADQHQQNLSPQVVNQTLVTQTGKQGKYQGLLEINFGTKRRWGQNREKELADLQNRLGSLNWQLRRLEKKSASGKISANQNSTMDRLRKNKDEMSAKIISLQETIDKGQSQTMLSDRYQYRFIGLKKNMPNDIPTEELLKQLNQQIRQLHKNPMKQNRTTDAQTLFPQRMDLVGYRVCESCHLPQTEFWRSTKHAEAYTTLVRKEKNLDLECLLCHVTQDLFSTSFQIIPTKGLLSLPRELQSVGCETCHGAGKKHSVNPERFKMVRLPGQDICLTCHTPEHDDNYNYETKLPLISCPAG